MLARHSHADVSKLAHRLGLQALHLSRKGQAALGRGGRRLPYPASDSRCLVEVATQEHGTLAQGVTTAVTLLEPHRDFIRELSDAGGEVQVFARWYPTGDTGETFPSALLMRLASLGVTFGFNVYGVPPAGGREEAQTATI